MSDSNVRTPWSEPADPFGDDAWAETPPHPARQHTEPTPRLPPANTTIVRPPANEPVKVPLGFEPEPKSDSSVWPSVPKTPTPSSSTSRPIWSIRGFLAFGVARVIGGLVFLAITGGGWSLFTDLSNDGPPNVPQHVLDACWEVRLDTDLAASIGAHIAYEQSGEDALVTFRTPGGDEWICRWSNATNMASIEGAPR